jgi:hypothetical protein
MSVNELNKRLLAFRSGNRCAFSECTSNLSSDLDDPNPVTLGEVAHIKGENPGSPRYDDTMTDEERNDLPNLLYLCPNHHTLIDKQHESFSVEDLLKMKQDHENRVRELITEGFSDVTFEELSTATSWIKNFDEPINPNFDFNLTAIEEKINKNQLTTNSRIIIKGALGATDIVQNFINFISDEDETFPERLKSGFLVEYYKLKKDGLFGDELFEMMCKFSQKGMTSQAEKSASIAVLIYFFEKCEIFIK